MQVKDSIYSFKVVRQTNNNFFCLVIVTRASMNEEQFKLVGEPCRLIHTAGAGVESLAITGWSKEL